MSEYPLAPIAVLRGGAVGDFVLTLPAIAALRAANPGHPLWIAGHPERASLARPDRIIDADGPALLPLYGAAAHPGDRRDLRGTKLTLAYLPGADPKLTSRLELMTAGEVWVADPLPPPVFAGHMVEHLLLPLRERGVPVADPVPHLELGADEYRYADGLEVVSGSPTARTRTAAPLVCLHPGSGGIRKCWPQDRFAALAATLVASGMRCVVVLGPVEEERNPGLEAALAAGIGVARPPHLLALAGLLGRADLLVGNDSGPAHLAAALGTPTLALFGPTDPRLWAPCGARGGVLRAPGGDLGNLTLEAVRRASLAVLDGTGVPDIGL